LHKKIIKQNCLQKIACTVFLYYDGIKRWNMNFFREHRKAIVIIIGVSFLLWAAIPSLIAIIPMIRG